ncbi:MAG: cation:dicarboxylase symporter family transporter [Cyanobacteria bacterium P01_D01_bin.105]
MIARSFSPDKLLSINGLVQLLRSPWAIAFSVILAVYVGTTYPGVTAATAPIGQLYLGLLKMCVFPVLLSAITSSIGRLMGSPEAKRYVQRIVVVFPLGLLMVSSLTAIITAIARPGNDLSQETLSTLGVLVNQSGIDLEISLSEPAIEVVAEPGMDSFLLSLVPENIFSALSEGRTLQVLCFSIIVGVSLGLLKEQFTDKIFSALDSIYQSFNQLIHWLTVILPFGLFSLLSYQLSQQGLEVVTSMFNFIVVALGTFLAIYALSTLVIWRRTALSLPSVLLAMRETTILALATSSSLACLPSAIATLSDQLKLERQTIKLVTPLSITICRFGSVIYFSLGALFVAQLYEKSLGVSDFVIIIVGSILAGMATSGVSGILTLTMLGIVLEPLKLPLEAVLVLFIAIDPLMDPFRTLSIVHTGMAATAVVAQQQSSNRLNDPP